MRSCIALALLVATCYAQDEQSEAVEILSSQNDRVARNVAGGIQPRSPIFFFTQTITASSTVTTYVTTTVTTASFCTTTKAAGLANCAGRRRRAIEMSDQEFLELINPSAVYKAEVTEAPEMRAEPKREAREAQYFDYVMPTFHQVNPRFGSSFRSPYFRQNYEDDDEFQPQGRQFIASTTTTTISTVTSTLTMSFYTSFATITVSCILTAPSIAACGT